MADKPNFALLIGKKLDEKEKSGPPSDDKPVMELPGSGEAPADDEGSSMQDSAVADIMAAFKSNNIPLAKQALKDFIDLIDQDSATDEAPPNGEM